MNQDVYNPRVANFKKKINDLKNNILNGTTKIETTSDFNSLIIDVKAIFEEGESIYNGIVNSVSKSQLEEYLECENEFILLLNSLLQILEKYHNYVFITKEDLQEEWSKVITILKYYAMNEKMNGIMKFLFVTRRNNPKYEFPNSVNNEIINLNTKISLQEDTVQENVNQIIEMADNAQEKFRNNYQSKINSQTIQCAKEAINAIDNLMDKLDCVYDKDFYEDDNNFDVKDSDIKLDEDYLASLGAVTAKIEYLNLTIANIEKARGKKMTVKYKGNKKRISKNFISAWTECQTKLNKYQEQYEKEIEALTNDIENETEKETYAKLYTQINEIKDRMYELGKKAKQYLNTSQVVPVATFDGEPFYVLKNDLSKFNEIFVIYKRLQAEIKSYVQKIGIEEIETEDEFKELVVIKKNLFEKINFLKSNGNNNLEVEKERKKLETDLQKVTKSEKLARFADVYEIFKKSPITEKTKELFTSVTVNPKAFIKSKEFNLSEKKQILSNVIKYAPKTIEENIEKSITNNIGTVKLDLFEASERKKRNKVKVLLDSQFNKVRRCLNILPKDRHNVVRIGNIKDAKNSKKISFQIASAAAIFASFLGINTLLQSNNVERNKEAIEVNIDNNSFVAPKVLKEEKLVDNASAKELNDSNLSSYFNGEDSSIYDLNNIFSANSLNDMASNNSIDANINELEKTEDVEEALDSIISELEEAEKITEDNRVNNVEVNENRQNYDFGDVFITKDDKIYQTANDAYNETNSYSSYFSNDSYRTIEGITYEYNGETLTIFSNEPEAMDKQIALKNNGAVQVAVVSKNVNSNNNGYEGFYNVDNIDIIDNAEGRGM